MNIIIENFTPYQSNITLNPHFNKYPSLLLFLNFFSNFMFLYTDLCFEKFEKTFVKSFL